MLLCFFYAFTAHYALINQATPKQKTFISFLTFSDLLENVFSCTLNFLGLSSAIVPTIKLLLQRIFTLIILLCPLHREKQTTRRLQQKKFYSFAALALF